MTRGKAVQEFWHVELSEEARDDLRKLKRQERKVWQQAVDIIGDLANDPHVGDECRRPLAGCRRIHFWNDEYRIVWKAIESKRTVYLLGVGLKRPDFYGEIGNRLEQ